MRVIVTRPRADALRWVQALGAQGIDAMALPLIEIHPLSDSRVIAAAWHSCLQYQAIMFVSAAAVDHFFAARPPDATLGNPEGGPRLWATGPGTVAALVRQGVATHRIDAPSSSSGPYDSETLWHLVGSQVRACSQVLLVRGGGRDVSLPPQSSVDDASVARDDEQGEGRDWLSARLEQAGAQVRFVVAYWRAAPGTRELRQALGHLHIGDDALWLFTSAQAIRNLVACLPERHWSGSRAIASHARIAEAARSAGFGVVRESRPALADMAASIKSMLP